MILSYHLSTTEVKATRQKSFKQTGCAFFGTGIMMYHLKHAGTMFWLREELKMSLNTGAIWSMQALMTCLSIPPGPAAAVLDSVQHRLIFRHCTTDEACVLSSTVRCHTIFFTLGFWLGKISLFPTIQFSPLYRLLISQRVAQPLP